MEIKKIANEPNGLKGKCAHWWPYFFQTYLWVKWLFSAFLICSLSLFIWALTKSSKVIIPKIYEQISTFGLFIFGLKYSTFLHSALCYDTHVTLLKIWLSMNLSFSTFWVLIFRTIPNKRLIILKFVTFMLQFWSLRVSNGDDRYHIIKPKDKRSKICAESSIVWRKNWPKELIWSKTKSRITRWVKMSAVKTEVD